jgi:uracil-DNA glycosylase
MNTFLQEWMKLQSNSKDLESLAIESLKKVTLSKQSDISSTGKNKLFPPTEKIFRAFEFFPPSDLKVVILGQDPYHNEGSATGLAFQDGLEGSERPLRPSLRNIENKLGHKMDFEYTAKNGVLWLNTALTVEEGKPNSHKYIWKPFTEALIKEINTIDGVIWVLWGGNALGYKHLITNETHQFVISSHPSPLSFKKKLKDHPPFEESDPFNFINTILNFKLFYHEAKERPT